MYVSVFLFSSNVKNDLDCVDDANGDYTIKESFPQDEYDETAD